MTHQWHLVLLGTLSASCVPALDEDLSSVDSPRLLAVIAEPPEAAEGESVSLTALVAGPSGTLSEAVSYAACLARKPLSELGPVSPSCLEGGTSESLQPLGSGGSVQATIERGACSSFGPRRPTAEAGQPAGRPVDPDPTGGFYQPVVASLPGQRGVLGAVRLDCGLPGADREQIVEYNRRHRPNQNPRIERLERLEGNTWVELPPQTNDGPAVSRVAAGEELSLRASWESCGAEEACTGVEAYVRFDAPTGLLVDREEVLLASWYATGGSFEEYRTGAGAEATAAENRWLAPTEAGSVEIWVVLRDGRGGVGYGASRFSVE